MEELTIPEYVVEAQKYIEACHLDMGFCGSPRYTESVSIVEKYYEPIRAKELEEKERQEYQRLKQKFQ